MTKQDRQVDFTDRRCERLPGPEPGDRSKAIEYSDLRVRRLKFSVSETGLRTWYWRYTLNGAKRSVRIGEFPGITTEQARRMALELGALLDQGIDPQAEKLARKATPTLAEFANDYYLPHARAHKRSADDDASKLKLWILPKLGRKRLCDITRHDVDLHRTEMAKSHSAGTANRHHALLARMLALAVEWDLLKANPAAGLRKLKEPTPVEDFLEPEQVQRLLAALDEEPNKVAAGALKVLAFSGLRREEVAQARWEDLDAARGLLRLTRTKSGRARWVPLNPFAQKAIADLPESTSPWIFPGRDPGRPICNLRKPFHRALARAGLPEMPIHRLRHSFASNAVAAGVSLFSVQNLLGHKSAAMTIRYSHLAGQALHEASAATARAMTATRNPEGEP
jgi:integrase